MRHRHVCPLETGSRIDGTADEDALQIDHLTDGSCPEGPLAFVDLPVDESHVLVASGPMPDNHGAVVVDP